MKLLSYFTHKPISGYAYMLQQVEYSSLYFLKWLIRLPNLNTIQQRQRLVITTRVMFLKIVTSMLLILSYSLSIFLYVNGVQSALILILLTPIFAAIILALVNFLLDLFVIRPKMIKEIAAAKQKLDKMDVFKIAIIGSYGKTTAKEIINTVLSAQLPVAATPGNKNVLISHARWVNKLTGNEKVLIFEYGEANPGDIKKLLEFSNPSIAIITGLAAAHLEGYKSLDAVASDFKTVYEYLDENNVYINADSKELAKRLHKGIFYSSHKIDDWTVRISQNTLNGMQFTMSKSKQNLNLRTSLVGKHLLGVLALSVVIATRLQLSKEDIIDGIAGTKPFEHRMQPYQLGGAWVIDDTYNGNLEGMTAGLEMLKTLKAKRKMYVTPGLVEQGDLKESVHVELGLLIANTAPDLVVLMDNSTTRYIRKGLEQGKFNGKLKVETNPLHFYSSLEHFIAAGDVVMMQNDWTDNYL